MENTMPEPRQTFELSWEEIKRVRELALAASAKVAATDENAEITIGRARLFEQYLRNGE